MDDAEFKAICLEKGGLRPLGTVTERSRWAANARGLADKHIRAARRLLGDGDEEHFVVHHAYFAMEHKANELLATSGHHSRNHLCTQIALSRLLKREDLASVLSRAYSDRQVYDYTTDPETMASAQGFEGFVGVAETFMREIDALVRAKREPGS